MEIVHNRIKADFIKKYDTDKIIKQHYKLTFNGIHKSYTIYDRCIFKQREVPMDKPIYLGFAILELSKLLMYETNDNKLQPYFGENKLQLQYMDTDSFALGVNTKKIIEDLKKT